MKTLKEIGQGGADWMLQESSASKEINECKLSVFLEDIILEIKKNNFYIENLKKGDKK